MKENHHAEHAESAQNTRQESDTAADRNLKGLEHRLGFSRRTNSQRESRRQFRHLIKQLNQVVELLFIILSAIFIAWHTVFLLHVI